MMNSERILVFGLIHTASQAEPSRTDSAWITNLRYEMEAFALHAEPSRTGPSLTERVPWLMFLFTRQPTKDSVAQ
jgi:hypothetical protein